MADMLSQLFAQAQAGEDASAGAQSLLTAPEAERMIEQLQPFTLADVGTPRWHTQREWIGRMNVQAHTNAMQHADEFIVELLVSLDKMKALVHELLVIETWKLHVLPHLRRHLAQKVDLSYAYMVLYHECSVANLLEVTLFHPHACEALPEEHLLELADWCARKLTFLAGPAGRTQADAPERTAQELLSLSKEQEFADKEAEVDFGAAMCAITISRYLSDNVAKLPMGLMGRMLTTNDFPMVLVALLDKPPWSRRRGSGGKSRLEKWMDNSWQPVPPADRLKLTQLDAQVWLTLNNLVVEPRCRAKYGHDEWRRDKLLTLKRHMNELLFDQLPVLKDLQRTLDEMALGVGPDSAAHRTAALMLEVVPELRAALLRAAADPRQLALEQARTVFSEEEMRRTGRAQLEALMKQLDFLVEAQPKPPEVPAAGGAADAGAVGQLGPVKVSCWRKAHESGVFESWCDYAFELDHVRPPEPVALEHLHGLRYRLLAVDPSTVRAMPADGKVVVRLPTPSGTSGETLLAEALLQLPDIPVKSVAGEKPPVVWVNIGLLAEDGMVLQLKLKRGETGAHERDKTSGTWYAYQPAGGALTVLRDKLAPPAAAPKEKQGAGEVLTPAVGLVGIQGSIGAGGGKRAGAAPKVQAVAEQPKKHVAAGALHAAAAQTAAATASASKPQAELVRAEPAGGQIKAKIQVVEDKAAAAGVGSVQTAEPQAHDLGSELELPD